MRHAIVIAAIGIVGCKASVPGPCARITGTCIDLTVTSHQVSAIDTLLIAAGDPIAASTSSSLGHAGDLPIHLAITIPAAVSGSVHFDVTGVLSSAVVGVGSFESVLTPGQHVMASTEIEPEQTGDGDGGADLAGSTDMASTPPGAARLIAPLSTSTVTNHRPHVHWQLGASATNPQLDFCTTRACDQTIGATTIDANGLSGSPTTDLPVGTVFWRVRTTGPGGVTSSATWEFTVQKRAKQIEAVDSSWGTFLDVNGDGRGDVAVGAPLAPVKGVAGVGRTYVFNSNSTGFDTTPVILDGTGATNTSFGSQVLSAGDVNGDGYADLLVVDTNKQAFVFHGSPAGIATTPTTTLPPVASNESIAAAGDVNGDGYADLVIGVPQATASTGQVSLLLGGPGGLSKTPVWNVNGSETQMGVTSAQFGAAVAGAGDVNGDGYDDVVIGAPDQTHAGTSNTGAVYIYLGGAGNLTPYPTPPIADISLGQYGMIVAGANDLDGDGYADLLIGSGTAGSGTVNYAVSVIVGGPTTYQAGPKLTDPQVDSGFAVQYITVGPVGDIDGDGLADVVIGAPSAFPAGGGSPGAIHVYLSNTTGGALALNEQMPVRYGPDGQNGLFGVVAGAGDVNGDGRADVLVGALCAPSSAGCGNGTAYLFRGVATTGLPAIADQKWVGPDPGGHFGFVAKRDRRMKQSPFVRVHRTL